MNFSAEEITPLLKSLYDFMVLQDATQTRAKIKPMPKLGDEQPAMKGGEPPKNKPGTGVAKQYLESDLSGTTLSEISGSPTETSESTKLELAADDDEGIEDLDELELPEEDEEEEEKSPSKSASKSSSSKTESTKLSEPSSSASDLEVKSLMQKLTKMINEKNDLQKQLDGYKAQIKKEVEQEVMKKMKRAGWSSVSNAEVKKLDLGVDEAPEPSTTIKKSVDETDEPQEVKDTRTFYAAGSNLSKQSWNSLANMRIDNGELFEGNVYWKPEELVLGN